MAMKEHPTTSHFDFASVRSIQQPRTELYRLDGLQAVGDGFGEQISTWPPVQQGITERHIMNLGVEHWRQYATPAPTPEPGHGVVTQLTEDVLPVEMALEERTAEQANWDTFIRGFGLVDV